jgi:uncharacterized membrane protein YeaQ/YmgE (transglycosylase-associated protein family)
MELVISLICGAIGGNAAGKLMKSFDLGTIWNSVVGILGGGLGAQLLSSLGVLSNSGSSAMSLSGIISNVISSGVGGGILLAIVGFIKKIISK